MNLDELHKLSSEERAAYYRHKAETALRAAEIASEPGIRVAHLLMAADWEKLAEHCASVDRHRFAEAARTDRRSECAPRKSS